MTMRPLTLLVAAAFLGACTSASTTGNPTIGANAAVATGPTAAVPTATTTRVSGAATTALGPEATDVTASGLPTNTAGAGGQAAWVVDTSSCPDPAAATEPIAGTVRIALVAPTRAGVPAASWKPTVDGFREAMIRANLDRTLAPVGVEVVAVDVGADPHAAARAVQPAIDEGAQVVVAAGDDVNLALRFTLNEQCIPQVVGFASSPDLGTVAEYPWTMAIEPTTDVEAKVAGTLLAAQFPGGGTIGVYTADDAHGEAYRRSVDAMVGGVKFDVVADEVVDATAAAGSSDAVDRLAAVRPDVVIASTTGLDCAYFLRELALHRNRAPDWQPLVMVDAACATPAILGLAGQGADGVYSTSNLAGPGDPANADVPGVEAYTEWMTARGLAGEIPTAISGWTAAEALLAALRQAINSPGGLSRASIIDACRALDVVPTLGRPGVVLRTAGAADPFAAESAQVVRWDAQRRTFVAVGAVVTQFES